MSIVCSNAMLFSMLVLHEHNVTEYMRSVEVRNSHQSVLMWNDRDEATSSLRHNGPESRHPHCACLKLGGYAERNVYIHAWFSYITLQLHMGRRSGIYCRGNQFKLSKIFHSLQCPEVKVSLSYFIFENSKIFYEIYHNITFHGLTVHCFGITSIPHVQ